MPHGPAVLPSPACLLQSITEPAARAAFVWVLGEYGQRVQDAPYTLETLVEGFGGEAPEVKLVSGSSRVLDGRPTFGLLWGGLRGLFRLISSRPALLSIISQPAACLARPSPAT